MTHEGAMQKKGSGGIGRVEERPPLFRVRPTKQARGEAEVGGLFESRREQFWAKITKLQEHEDKRHRALSAAVAILQMDPHARTDLITYIKALNESQKAGDEQEQEYVMNAILEVFTIDGTEDGPDLETWERESMSCVAGRQAAKELSDETERFFGAYQRLKSRSGLATIRQVAEAAGLSPTTVQAIEKQRVKPQFRTLQSLAKAFKADVTELGK